MFQEYHIIQFTPESIQLRAKPKIIGFLDDAIYEKCKLIIFPELSMPESYLTKLQEFADRFNIFILVGTETVTVKSRYYNRAYFITPLANTMLYQQKNSGTRISSSEKFPINWVESIETTSPPRFSIFNSPFGRFLIMIGQDIKKYSQYIPFIAREKNLAFVVFLNNGIETENSYSRYQILANEINAPVCYVNTGQFGGTAVYEPNKESDSHLKKEYTEGIFRWTTKISEKPD
jgi:predicted amidohydrolase